MLQRKRYWWLSLLLAVLLLGNLSACDDDDDDDDLADDDDTDDDAVDDDAADDDIDDDLADDDTDDDIADDDVADDDSADDDTVDDDTADDDVTAGPTYSILDVQVEDHTTYRLMNRWLPQFTGDLWPCAWGEDDRLYTANGDGFGFGRVFGEIVFNVVDGYPPDLTGSTPKHAWGPYLAHKWGPEQWLVSRKPTGLLCLDGDLYLFYQNLKNQLSTNPFGDAPHASISVSRDSGDTWEYDPSEPMFTDHVFTTGFFLDYGKCQEHMPDNWVYVYGLDYNWRYSPDFDQTKLYLARVPRDRLMDREAWQFFAGLNKGEPTWSADIEDKLPVLEDDTLYRNDKSGIAQGSVIYLPQHNRYLYSTRAAYEWIYYDAAKPWGPWNKVAVAEWTGGWTPEYHAGYPAVMTTKFIDEDGLGGWMISSLSSSYFEGMWYNMCFRRFELEVSEEPEPSGER